jgi:O-acetylhomoserine/O-acetylserine sulfhydrylase-like pyridoxal-dependent enzyme
MKFNTKVIHGNQHAEPHTGSVNVPVFLTSTFAQKVLDNCVQDMNIPVVQTQHVRH